MEALRILSTISLLFIAVGAQNSRIIGGTPAAVREFPYAAAIYKTTSDGTYFCVGSILNHLWLITAGQCVEKAIMFHILLGTTRLNGNDTSLQKLSTETYVLHPNYNPNTLEHDIGLIRFRMPILFTGYVRQLHLPPVDLQGTIAGIAFGWGQVTDKNSSLSDSLNSVKLVSVTDAECRLTYGGQLGVNMMCFQGSFNEGTCYGDGGSPLIQHFSIGYTVVIAISTFFSANGCESTDPSGYTKIFPYKEWIEDIIKST